MFEGVAGIKTLGFAQTLLSSRPWGVAPIPYHLLKKVDENFNFEYFIFYFFISKHKFFDKLMLATIIKQLIVKVWVKPFQRLAESEAEPQGFGFAGFGQSPRF